jgi:hypothetical protein
MNRKQSIALLKELVKEIDYDHYQYTFGNLIEDEEENEEHINSLVEIIQKHTQK